jgi:hypothetical protein
LVLAGTRNHALLPTVMLALVPVACGGDDSASEDGQDPTTTASGVSVRGPEVMVVVVELGNGECASVFVSANGENPIPGGTREAVRSR